MSKFGDKYPVRVRKPSAAAIRAQGGSLDTPIGQQLLEARVGQRTLIAIFTRLPAALYDDFYTIISHHYHRITSLFVRCGELDVNMFDRIHWTPSYLKEVVVESDHFNFLNHLILVCPRSVRKLTIRPFPGSQAKPRWFHTTFYLSGKRAMEMMMEHLMLVLTHNSTLGSPNEIAMLPIELLRMLRSFLIKI